MLKIRKNNLFKRIIALTLCVCMLTTALPFFTTSVYAASKTGVLKAVIDGTSEFDIRKLDFEYENNTYLSLRDIATALNNTSKAFSFEVTNNGAGLVVRVNTNENYSNPYTAEVEEDSNADEGETNADEGETNDESADDGSMSDVDAGNADSDDNIDASDANASDNASGEQKVAKTVNHARNRINICIDDVDYYFYAMIVKDDDAVFDCYMSLTEFSIVMNVDCKFEDGRLVINSENDFNLAEMNFEELGVYDMVNSCLVGDATTGEIFISHNEDVAVPIASTTKLMTYLLVKEALSSGVIDEYSPVCFSKKAEELSQTGDGVIPLYEGMEANLLDVIKAMLICSSNECALSLAEHVSGSEEEFVELMNRKAIEIGMSEDAKFYNSNGLPFFVEGDLVAKRQNHISAHDMFLLVAYIMDKYPEITEITSIKKTKLESLGNREAKNTNVLLYNIPGAVGLKTGTTSKAQSCLVSAVERRDKDDNIHYVVAIVFGAENAYAQNYTSYLLLNYGIGIFNTYELGIVLNKKNTNIVPDSLEKMITTVLNVARQKKMTEKRRK